MERTELPVKPLGMKAYGSIPHLNGSRRGPGDHGVNEGQHLQCTSPAKLKDPTMRVWAQEKLDGSCVSVARIGDDIHILGRAGYPAITSPYHQHRMFDYWARARRERFLELLNDGERVVGEWLAQAHGTRYDLTNLDPFVAFDIMCGPNRLPCAETTERCKESGFSTPFTFGGANTGVPIETAMKMLGWNGFHGAIEPIEGAVWRVESHTKKGMRVLFLAKYVRPDKADGCYLPEVSGKPIVWNRMHGASSPAN